MNSSSSVRGGCWRPPRGVTDSGFQRTDPETVGDQICQGTVDQPNRKGSNMGAGGGNEIMIPGALQ